MSISNQGPKILPQGLCMAHPSSLIRWGAAGLNRRAGLVQKSPPDWVRPSGCHPLFWMSWCSCWEVEDRGKSWCWRGRGGGGGHCLSSDDDVKPNRPPVPRLGSQVALCKEAPAGRKKESLSRSNRASSSGTGIVSRRFTEDTEAALSKVPVSPSRKLFQA